jgi:hypothetical protein
MTTSDVVNLFNYVVIRSPTTVGAADYELKYIQDPDSVSYVSLSAGPTTKVSDSAILQAIFSAVYCGQKPSDVPEANDSLIQGLTQYLLRFYPPCDAKVPLIAGLSGLKPIPLPLHAFPSYASFWSAPYYYVLPDRVSLVNSLPWKEPLGLAQLVLARASVALKADDIGTVLGNIFGGASLEDVVFDGPAYRPEYTASARALFDSLYLCYIFRRKVSVNLEGLMSALQALHVIEAFAIDAAIRRIATGAAKPTDTAFVAWLAPRFEILRGWSGGAVPGGFPRTEQAGALMDLIGATPVVPPLVAQLFYCRWPFNDIKPLGIGDLKVVKQCFSRTVRSMSPTRLAPIGCSMRLPFRSVTIAASPPKSSRFGNSRSI